MHPQPTPPFVLRLFGAPQVLLDGQPMPEPRTRKGISLLALLALRGGEPLDRSRVASQLWPDSLDEQALYNLRRTLSDLREQLGAQAERLQSPTPRTLALDLTEAWVDVLEFDQIAADEQADHSHRGLDLYRGRLLEGLRDEWLLPEREAREEAQLLLMERCATRCATQGQLGRAATLWRQALRADPLRETALHGLLLTLEKNGAYTAAAEAFRDFRSLVRREMNAEPGAPTVAIYQRIRNHGREATPQPKQPLGSQWVGRAPSPGLQFFGREKEIREVRGLLEIHRAVVVTGPGGVGKTRLALEVARNHGAALSEAVAFVDLCAVAEEARVPEAVARALEVRLSASETPEQALLRFLTPRRLLVVLDNCEHVEAACSALLTEWVENCPDLRVLATSRHQLIAPHTVHFALPTFAAPAVLDPELLLMAPSVRLFFNRARQVSPGLETSPLNIAAAATICARLDGLPLAIELAAARVRGLSPMQIVERLEALLPSLHAGPLPSPARHRTLDAVVDWSHRLLSPEEALLFRRLGVFAGGFTLEGAEAICAGLDLEASSILLGLLDLVDRSLLQYEEVDGDGRYRLLETIRVYAADRLARSGEEEAIRDRHREYFMAMVEEAEDEMVGPRALHWQRRFDREVENIRAALRSPCPPESRLRIAGAFWRYWLNRGFFREAREHLEAVTAEHPERNPYTLRARAGLAAFTWYCGDGERAEEMFRRSLADAREMGDTVRITSALHNLGTIAMDRGDYATARDQLGQARDLARDGGNLRGLAFAVDNLGALAIWENELDEAERLLLESERLLHAAGLHQVRGTTLHNLGLIALGRGDFDRAEELLRQSVAIHSEFAVAVNVARSTGNLGALLAIRCNLPEARENLEICLREWQRLGSESGVLMAVTSCAYLAAAEGDFPRAAQLLAAVDAIRQARSLPTVKVWDGPRQELDARIEAAIPAHTLEAAQAAGRALTLDEAASIAL